MEPQRRTIDGVEFEVTPLGHKLARQGFVRLSKIIGPALAAAPTGQDADMQAALGMLVDRADDSDLEWFGDAFGKASRFSTDGGTRWPFLGAPEREALFTGRLMLYFQWLIFALEVNYSDFLDWLKRAAAGAAPPASE